jgi:uncharacterized paraquat-inducible protein A
MADHCSKCNRFLEPGASNCPFCGFVVDEIDQKSHASALGPFVASCMIFFGAILLLIGVIMSLFSFTLYAMIGGSLGSAFLLVGIVVIVFSYPVLRAGLSARDRYKKH